MSPRDKIISAIKLIRRRYGEAYPRNIAERKSLIIWLQYDVCKNMIDGDEVEKIASVIIG